jgi:hypothetical protein
MAWASEPAVWLGRAGGVWGGRMALVETPVSQPSYSRCTAGLMLTAHRSPTHPRISSHDGPFHRLIRRLTLTSWMTSC